MDQHEYSKKLDELRDITVPNVVALGQWVREEGLPWLWTIMAEVIIPAKTQHPNAKTPPRRGRLSPMGPAEAVRSGLRASLADRMKKEKQPSFYHAQLTMLHGQAALYCDAIDAFALNQPKGTGIFAEEAMVDDLHRALHHMMRYAYILLANASREIASNTDRFRAWGRQEDHPFEVFQGARQSIYGAYSGMAFRDRAPYAPVAVLRTAIELRMRRAFCISSYVNPGKPDQIIPIDVSRLFQAIQSRQDDIEFAVDVHDVWKIYRWSNFYLHAGVRDYPWVVGYVHGYLHPLFAGSHGIDDGIRMKPETWHAVRKALLPVAEPFSISQRLGNAWRSLWPKRASTLQIPPVDERHAQCAFLT
jgi:hypothetical protein